MGHRGKQNNLVGDFASEEEASQTVRELLDAFGDGFADDLQLGGRDDADRVMPFLNRVGERLELAGQPLVFGVGLDEATRIGRASGP